MSPPPGQNYNHEYHDSFREAKLELGLTGDPFDYFWQDIAEVLDDDPFNVYAKPVPDLDGLWAYPTAPAHLDFRSCLVLYSVEAQERQINYFGLAAVEDGQLVVPEDF